MILFERLYMVFMVAALVVIFGHTIREMARLSSDSNCRKYGFDAATYSPSWLSIVHCEEFRTGRIVPIDQARRDYEQR